MTSQETRTAATVATASEEANQRLIAELLALDPDNPVGQMMASQVAAQAGSALSPEVVAILIELRDQAAERKAQEILKREDFRTVICPMLQSMAKDMNSVLPVVVGGLFTLAAAGVAISLVPAVAASIAILVWRGGVASLCRDFPSPKEE